MATPLVGVVSWLAMLNANRMRDGRGVGGEEVGGLKCRILLTASCEEPARAACFASRHPRVQPKGEATKAGTAGVSQAFPSALPPPLCGCPFDSPKQQIALWPPNRELEMQCKFTWSPMCRWPMRGSMERGAMAGTVDAVRC